MMELENFRGLEEQLIADTSEDQPVYLLASKSGNYIRLSPSAYQLLHLRRSGVSFDAIAQELSQQTARNVSPDDVETAYRRVVERIAEIEANANRPRSGFLIRWPFLPERFVVRIASHLSVAFQPVVASCLLAATLVALAATLRKSISLDFTPASFWSGYALLLASTLVHEFGHASACVRYGARPSDIGFAVYLIYPAFYSDVSAAWELERWQRVVVDLGGSFFQLIVGAAYATAYALFDWEPFQVALLMILGNLVFSLNPVFRFDGYWVVADTLGVTNLGQQPRRVLRHLFARLRGQPTKPLPWSTPVKLLLLPYTLFSLGFWGVFIWKVAPVIGRYILTYPGAVTKLIRDLLDPSQIVDGGTFQSLLVSTYIVVIALLMVWRLSSPLLSSARSTIFRQARRTSR